LGVAVAVGEGVGDPLGGVAVGVGVGHLGRVVGAAETAGAVVGWGTGAAVLVGLT
jgi:hypothetical protein